MFTQCSKRNKMPKFINNPTTVSEIGVGQNAKGDATEIIRPEKPYLKRVAQPPDFCTCLEQCVPDLLAFTDGIGSDFYKNDFYSAYMRSGNQGGTVSTFLTFTKKIINVDTGVETTLLDSTHGDYYILKWAKWFKVSWYKISTTLGYGRYRIELRETSTTTGDVINEKISPIFHLKKYNDRLAARTVRIESYQNGRIANGNDYSNMLEYSSFPTLVDLGQFEQQIRLPGTLRFISGETENDHLVLDNADRSTFQIKDQERPAYELNIQLVSGKQIAPVIFDDLFSNPTFVTDYNWYNHVIDPRDFNAEQYLSIPLIKDSVSVDPSPRAKRATYTIGMKYAYDNIFKTNN